ncbi:MAG: hypothetical protein LBS21_14105 [Clostridiales bacterium]|nr:hypothetical protein [Clostridiales bacterium]
MKKITINIFVTLILILFINFPCVAALNDPFTYNKLSANLYCNDYQIDLSKFPLIDICDEVTIRNVTYVSSDFTDIFEVLRLYSGYNFGNPEFYTKDYLEQSREWMSRAELEANMLYRYGVRETGTIYNDKKNRSLYFDMDRKLSGFIKTVTCGENYYINVRSFYVSTHGYDEILERVIEKSAINEYDPGFSVAPVIYPEVNENYSFHDNKGEYDMEKSHRQRIIHDGVSLLPDSVSRLLPEENYWVYEYGDINDWRNIEKSSYYTPLKLTYEAIGCAVISDDEKQNYFIYSQDYLEESPNWKSIEKMQGIFAALGKLTGKTVTLRYDENEKCLYFENEAESVGITAAAFDENAYVRVSDATEAYKKLANTNITSPNTAITGSF